LIARRFKDARIDFGHQLTRFNHLTFFEKDLDELAIDSAPDDDVIEGSDGAQTVDELRYGLPFHE
jgi:hypothetical protein